MAKSKNRDALDSIKRTIAETQETAAALTASIARDKTVMDATIRELNQSDSNVAKRREKFMASITDKTTKAHKLTVDLGGGMTAQVTTELLNWGVRALGAWSPDGWVAANVDFLQGLPHFVMGLGIYIAELASRKNGQLPSTTREVISEASKLFSQLGFSNLVRALRVRYGDGKQKEIDIQALQAEKADLERRLKAMQQQPATR